MTKVALMSIEGPQSSTPSLTKMAADESCSAGSATGSSVLTVVGPKEIHHEEPFPKGTLVTIQPWVQRFPFNQNPSNVLMARVRDVEKLPDRLVAIYFQTFRPFEGEVVTRVTTHQHLGVLSGGIKRSSDDEIDAQRHKAYESRGRLDEDENRVYRWIGPNNCNYPKVFRPDPGPPGCGLMDCHDGFASEPDLLSIHETTVFVYCTHGKGHFAEISHLELQDIAPGSDAEIMYSNVDPDESKNIEHVENTAYAHLASKRRTKGVVFGFHGLEAAEMAKSVAVTALHVSVDEAEPPPSLLAAMFRRRDILVLSLNYPVLPKWLAAFKGICFVIIPGQPSPNHTRLCGRLLSTTVMSRITHHQQTWKHALNRNNFCTAAERDQCVTMLTCMSVNSPHGVQIIDRVITELKALEVDLRWDVVESNHVFDTAKRLGIC